MCKQKCIFLLIQCPNTWSHKIYVLIGSSFPSLEILQQTNPHEIFLLKNQLPWIITSQSPTQLNIFPSYIQKISNLTCLDFRFKISTEIPGAISSWLLFLILQYSAKIKKWVFNSEKQRRQHILLAYEKIKTKFHAFHFPFHVVYL